MKWIAIANVTLTILFAIKWVIERAKHLAVHDPQAFMIAKSNMEILKIRADMDKQEKEPAQRMQQVQTVTHKHKPRRQKAGGEYETGYGKNH